MKRRVLIIAYVALWLGAIYAANQIIAAEGKTAVLYVGAGLIGLNLVSRDALHDLFGRWLILKMGALIVAGSALSYVLNANSATEKIAIASAVAFAGSEALDAITYAIFHDRPWIERVNASNLVAAPTDTLLFLALAFDSVPFALFFAQALCKIAGGLVYSFLLNRRKVRSATA